MTLPAASNATHRRVGAHESAVAVGVVSIRVSCQAAVPAVGFVEVRALLDPLKASPPWLMSSIAHRWLWLRIIPV